MALCRIAGRRVVISRALRARTHGCVARFGRCSIYIEYYLRSVLPRALPCLLLTPLVGTEGQPAGNPARASPGALGWGAGLGIGVCLISFGWFLNVWLNS